MRAPRPGLVLPTITEAIAELERVPEDLRCLREAGITQAQLARGLGVGQSTVCMWAKGQRVPSALMLRAIQLAAERLRRGDKLECVVLDN